MIPDYAVAVFTQNATLYQRLAGPVSRLGGRVAQFPRFEQMDALERFAQGGDLIALVDTSQRPELGLRWIRRLVESWPDAIPVCIQKAFNPEYSLQAVRAGARDLLIEEFSAEEVQSLLKRLAATFRRHRPPSTVLAVLGAAGGCGVSTVVANLGVEIARLHAVPVGILGLSACSGGAELLLNLRPAFTLFDLWQQIDSLDATLVQQTAATHRSGVSVITSVDWPPQQLPIPPEAVRRVVLAMQELFPYVLLELPREFPPAVRAALDGVETLLLVTHYSMAAAAGAARTLEALDCLYDLRPQIRWVANAVSSPAALSLAHMRRVMSCKPMAKIPFDPKTVNRAAAQGICLSEADPRGVITRSIQKLAASLCRFPCATARPDRRLAAPGHGPRSPAAISPAESGT